MTATALDQYESTLPAERRAYERGMLRRKAASYRRDIRVLLAWTFPKSRQDIAMGEVYPSRSDITHHICHRLYRDLQDAKAMPGFFRRRIVRIQVLRELFACECWLYRNQRASVNAQDGMNEFLKSLAAE